MFHFYPTTLPKRCIFSTSRQHRLLPKFTQLVPINIEHGNIQMAKKNTKASKKATEKNSKKELETLNETGKRKSGDRRQKKTAAQAAADAPAVERRKTKRRRQIDPTTCERDYTEAEVEFMQAMDEYKQASGRMFPTCSEILEVLNNIGYRKVAEAQDIYNPEADDAQKKSDETLDAMEEEFA